MSIRFDNYNRQRKQTNISAANAMSQLEGLLLQALKQQAYFHKDPDGIFTDEDDRAIITKGAADLIPSWQVNLDRVNDIVSVINREKQIDEVITKHNINLDSYRKELE